MENQKEERPLTARDIERAVLGMFTIAYSIKIRKLITAYQQESEHNEKEAFNKLCFELSNGSNKFDVNILDDFRNFVLLVEQTRQAQKQYFATRSKLHLEIAVKKEQQTDEEINRLFDLYKLCNNKIS